MNSNKYTLPLAIVVAGILIAGALFWKGNPNQKNVNTTQKSYKVDLDPVTANDYILGNPNASILVVEYSDTECPFCKDFHETMNKLVGDYSASSSIAWVYRSFPIEKLHPKALKEAEALECATELGQGNNTFWQYTNKIYEITPSNNKLDPKELINTASGLKLNVTAFEQCLNSGKYTAKVKASIASGQKAGVSGTPSSILVLKTEVNQQTKTMVKQINAEFLKRGAEQDIIYVSEDGKRVFVGGALGYDLMKQIIDSLLSN